MTVERAGAAQELARRVAVELRAGLALGSGVLETIRETASEPRANARRAVELALAGRDCCELGHLAALLLQPDEDLLARLEPQLAEAGVEESALADALAALAEGGGLAVTLLPPGGGAITVQPTPQEARELARRLRAGATAPAELRDILARRFSPIRAARLGALLRHCRLEWDGGRVFFLSTLLERLDPLRDDVPSLLGWATHFLSLLEPGTGSGEGPRAALARRRRALEGQLRQARFAEEEILRGSFEVRMAQGQRLGHVHGPDVEAELALLDRACLLVLGVPGAALDAPVTVRDLGRAEGVADVLRLLPPLPGE